MKKILFLIHDLSLGGAEKVLVNLVNNIDREKFDITVISLFAGGVNERFLKPHIHYHTVFKRVFRGNSKIMKLFTPEQLHRYIIRDHYDIEIAYLEGPCARIISGCTDTTTSTAAWIHCTIHSKSELARSFRSYNEAVACYRRIDKVVCVSENVKQAFTAYCPVSPEKQIVIYNTNDSKKIMDMSKESDEVAFDKDSFNWCVVGKLVPVKNQKMAINIQKRLNQSGNKSNLYILGEGELKNSLKDYSEELNIADSVFFMGYQTNPYKYVAACNLFVCSSLSEGFSTAATEALIVGTPVCTVDVSGMKEMLGENNEYGIITENSEEALYQGIKKLIDDPQLLAHYRKQAAIRGESFSTENTVKAVEDMLFSI